MLHFFTGFSGRFLWTRAICLCMVEKAYLESSWWLFFLQARFCFFEQAKLLDVWKWEYISVSGSFKRVSSVLVPSRVSSPFVLTASICTFIPINKNKLHYDPLAFWWVKSVDWNFVYSLQSLKRILVKHFCSFIATQGLRMNATNQNQDQIFSNGLKKMKHFTTIIDFHW